MMKAAHGNEIRYAPPGTSPHRSGFVQNRLQNVGLTLVVMGASFSLYYLGLFGGVEGPLQPERIGDRLAASGVTDRHLLILFLLCMVIAITWNWLYNGMNRLLGKHMICGVQTEGSDGFCDRPILRLKSGASAGRHICLDGHHSGEVRFRTVKKGTVGHFIWMMFLVFSVIVFLS